MRKRNLGVGEVSTSDSIPQRSFFGPFWPLPFKTAGSALDSTLKEKETEHWHVVSMR